MILRVGELIDELQKHERTKLIEVYATTILNPQQQIELLKQGFDGGIGGLIRSVEEQEQYVVIYASDS